MYRIVVGADRHLNNLKYYGNTALVQQLGIVAAPPDEGTEIIIHVVDEMSSMAAAMFGTPSHPGILDDHRVVILFSEDPVHFCRGIDHEFGTPLGRRYPGRVYYSTDGLLDALERDLIPVVVDLEPEHATVVG